MSADHDRVQAELPLPLGPDADVLDAVNIAVAIEDGCGVTLPEEMICVAALGTRESVRALLASIGEPV